MKLTDCFAQRVLTWLCLAVFVMAPLNAAMAANNAIGGDDLSALTNTMCAAVNILTGPIARVLVMLISFFVGVMLLLGKLQWSIAIGIGFGIGIVFGAKDLANVLSGGNSGTMCV